MYAFAKIRQTLTTTCYEEAKGRFERGGFDQDGDFGVYGQLSPKLGECSYMHRV